MSHGLPTEPTDAFPYRIEHEAGTGAMGVVYRAVEPLLERAVAIKVLKSDEGKDSESHQRFLQEARAAAGLSHPGVTTVFRIGEINGSPYLVMEWLDGQTLEDLIKSRGPLPIDEASQLILELLDVLAVAHRAGVVHRDLKPSNLVVLDSGRLKVMDFGIALLQGRKLVETMIGTVLATPQFASPEQLQGGTLDGRSDLFSATLLFYYLLSGTLPFDAKHLGELLSAIISGTPVPITQRRRDLGPDADAFFDRGLAKTAADRFPDADAMADALRRLALPPATATNPQTATTRMIAPPKQIVAAQEIDSPWRAVQAVVESWPSQDLGRQPLRASLEKLLDKPFHTEAFAGAAHFGDTCLLVADSVILATVDLPTGRLAPDVDLPDAADLRLFNAPSDQIGTLPSLVGTLNPGPAIHEGLDTELVDLPGLIGRQLDEQFDGHMRLMAEGAMALLIFSPGSCPIGIFGGAWSATNPGDWMPWLGSVRAKTSVLPTRIDPPASWYRLGYAGAEYSIQGMHSEPVSPRTSTGALASVVDTAAHRSGARFFQLRQASGPSSVAKTSIDHAPARRILEWMFDQLPYELAERKKMSAWKYLGDWLVEAEHAQLYTELERPGSGKADAFDLVTTNAAGKVLHIAHRCGKLDADALNALVERVITAKEARTSTGDIGGVLLVSPRIEPSADVAYKELLSKGGSRFFGIDKSTGYDGFVRLSARRGFHLLLVEENDESFRPRFEV